VKIYLGIRDGKEPGAPIRVLTNDGRPLENPEPKNGTFEWGYFGGGPSNLSFAILLDCLGDEERARELCIPFKAMLIGNLPIEGWTLTEDTVREVIRQIETRS
jgi:Family of unknown function (DUF6166)